jgi:hypothetical protein
MKLVGCIQEKNHAYSASWGVPLIRTISKKNSMEYQNINIGHGRIVGLTF